MKESTKGRPRLVTEFDRVGVAQRHKHFRSSRPGNLFTKVLTEAYVATGEPVFLDAARMGDLYGFNDGDALRKIRQVGALMTSARAVPAVDAELARQREASERPSLRKAYARAAVEVGVEAPTLEAARKRVESTYKASASGKIPSGDTGGEILVGRGEITETAEGVSVSGKANWLPDNLHTRRLVAVKDYTVFDHRRRLGTVSSAAVHSTAVGVAARYAAVMDKANRRLDSAAYEVANSPEGRARFNVDSIIMTEAALHSAYPGWKADVPSELLLKVEAIKTVAKMFLQLREHGPSQSLKRARHRRKRPVTRSG